MLIAKILILTVVLNLVRYSIGGIVERWTVMDPMVSIMSSSAGHFNTSFTRFDWATSYAYNFAMWLVAVVVVHLLWTVLRGSPWRRSFIGFGLMFLMFAAISFIYMNHYSHPKSFYVYSVLDGMIVYTLVAMAHAILYPRFFQGRWAHRADLQAASPWETR